MNTKKILCSPPITTEVIKEQANEDSSKSNSHDRVGSNHNVVNTEENSPEQNHLFNIPTGNNNVINNRSNIQPSNQEIIIPQFVSNINEQRALNYTNSPIKSNFDELYKQYAYIMKKEKAFIIVFSIAIVLCVILLILSLAMLILSMQIISFVLIAVCLISIIVFIFGIFVIKYNAKLIKTVMEKKDDPERIAQSRERIYLYICIYFFTLIVVSLLIIGTCLLAFQTNLKMNIRAEGYDKEKWKDWFNNSSFDNIIDKVTIIVNIIGVLTIIVSLYVGTFSAVLVYYIRSYKTQKMMIQFACIIFFQLSLVVLFFGLNCLKYNKILHMDNNMPEWFTGGIFGLAIVGIVAGLFGFFATFLERKIIFWICFIINVALFIIFLVINVGGTKLTSQFDGYEKANCASLFQYIDEDYLIKEMSCDSKYLFVNDNIENMQCPKYRITFVWEVNEKLERTKKEEGDSDSTSIMPSRKYGCINQNCCLNSYSSIKTQYDYSVLMSFVLMMSCIFLAVNIIYMIRNTGKIFDEELKDKMIYIFIFVVSLAVFIIIITFIALIPSAPHYSRIAEYDRIKVEKTLTIVNSTEVLPLSKSEFTTVTNKALAVMQNKVIRENKYNIYHENTSAKGIDTFSFTITTQDGVLSINKQNNMNMVSNTFDETTKISTVSFKGDQSLINSYLNYITIKPRMITLPLRVTTVINGEVVASSRLRNLEVQNETVNGIDNDIIIDYSTSQIGDELSVLNTEIDYSIVDTNSSVTLSGNVLDKTNNVYIEITSDYIEEPIATTFTNNEGQFSIGPIFPLLSGEPFLYNITFREVDINKQIIDNDVYYQDTIRIGGIGFTPSYLSYVDIILPPITQSTEVYYVSAKATDSETNSFLKGVSLKVYKGNKVLSQEDLVALSSSQNVGEELISINTVDGTFEFNLPSMGQYTAVYSKTNYYIETVHFSIYSSELLKLDPVAMTPVNNLGQASFVLSWHGKTKDLDLHLKFRVDEEVYCDVFFGNKECLDTEFNQDTFIGTEKGVENISIKKLGKYIYMFFVHKYTDVSGGVAYGEEKIDGVDPEEHFYFYPNTTSEETNDEDAPLINSRASIKIFGPVFWTPISVVNIPENINLNGNEEEYKYWAAFCINGEQGMSSLKIINKLYKSEPDITECENLYQ